jgi:hypothetical protein
MLVFARQQGTQGMTRTTANPCVHKATKSELDSSDVYQFEEKQQQLQWEQVQLSIFMAVVCSTTTKRRKRYASLMWGHLGWQPCTPPELWNVIILPWGWHL